MATKKWTILAYLAGDNGHVFASLDSEGGKDINEMAKVGSSDDLNIVVQFDRDRDQGTRRFYITKNGGYDTDAVQELGQTNCGDPKVLEDFLEWGIKNYPAERYMVVLWGHGTGWDEEEVYNLVRELSPEGDDISPFETRKIHLASGKSGIRRSLFSTSVEEIAKLKERLRAIGYDDGSKDFLDNKELKNVLSSVCQQTGIEKFDIVGFDACLMNMLEVNYQIRDSARIIVGSEGPEPSEGWPFDKILGVLAEEPDTLPIEFAKIIVDEYVKSYDGTDSTSVTQSAVNLEKIDIIKDRVNKLADNLIREIKKDDVYNAVWISASNAQNFYDVNYLDLYDFARIINENSPNDEIGINAQEIMNALNISSDGYVIASKSLSKEMQHTHGVSIYFPGRNKYSRFYDGLDFTEDGKWNSFIKAYQEEYDKER